MSKNIKEVLSSKIFFITIIISIFFIVLFFINYAKALSPEYINDYDITYSEDINDYDNDISVLEEQLIELEAAGLRREDYLYNKVHISRQISIYEQLKNDNIDYSRVYDFGLSTNLDPLSFYEFISSYLTIIMLINCLVIVYLLFTREFDNNSYYLIYTKKRKIIVIKKFLTSLLMIVSVFLVYLGIILIIGSFFNEKFNYVLIFSEEKPFYISTAKYIFSDIVMFVFYLSIFFNILFFTIALVFKKSYSSVLFFIGIIAIVFILGTLKCNIIPYLGLAVDYSVIDYKYRLLVKLPIILTVLLFVFSLYKFEHSDL